MKSAAMARLSGARRVIGFEARALREGAAALVLRRDRERPDRRARHQKESLGPAGARSRASRRDRVSVSGAAVAGGGCGVGGCGLARRRALRADQSRRRVAEQALAARSLRRAAHGTCAIGISCRRSCSGDRDEAALADAVVAASDGAAVRAPETTLGDLLALSSRAALMVSGDTGPIHLAAAIGTPIVGSTARPGPSATGRGIQTTTSSRAPPSACAITSGSASVGEPRMCLNEITVAEVVDAVDRRWSRGRTG